MINEHVSEWLGYPVRLFDIAKPVGDYRNTVYRLAAEYDSEETNVDLLNKFLKNPASRDTPAIIFGAFGEHDTTSEPIVEALVAAKDRLPNLKGIFLGDILSEENEISWIQQSNVTPLFAAYPALEHFRVRGGTSLEFTPFQHQKLKSLVVETGGLGVDVIKAIFDSTLPALEHLELWLGEENYGWNGSVADLQPVLDGSLFPALKYLGLRDSEIADEIAAAAANAQVLKRISILDLSLGSLTDTGGNALLASPGIKALRKLDLHHHFLSHEVMAQFGAAGINADLSDQKEAESYGGEEYRYIAVSE